jgi:hypothetical protein
MQGFCLAAARADRRSDERAVDDVAPGAAEPVHDAISFRAVSKRRRRRLLLTTKTLEKAIAAPAISGLR